MAKPGLRASRRRCSAWASRAARTTVRYGPGLTSGAGARGGLALARVLSSAARHAPAGASRRARPDARPDAWLDAQAAAGMAAAVEGWLGRASAAPVVGVVGTMASELPSHRGRRARSSYRRGHGKATCRPVGAGGAQAGLLADGSSSIGAFPRPWGRSGDLPISSPLTVAGAASVLHRLPSFAAGTRCPDSTKRSRGLSKNRAPCRSRFRYCQPAAFLTCYMVLCRIIARDRALDGVILELRL